MFKKLILGLTLCASLYAVEDTNTSSESEKEIEMSRQALGAIFSSGLGSGVMHRLYIGDDYYMQNAGIIVGYKDEYNTDFYLNYGLSFGRYLYSQPDSAFHFKAIVGAEYTYEENSYSYEIYNYNTETYTTSDISTNISKTAIVDVGIGFEVGSRESGNLMLALDIMYAFEMTSFSSYRVAPKLGISAYYNW